jgi:hypothetical protein
MDDVEVRIGQEILSATVEEWSKGREYVLELAAAKRPVHTKNSGIRMTIANALNRELYAREVLSQKLYMGETNKAVAWARILRESQ